MHEETISEKEQTPNRSRHCNDHNGGGGDDDGDEDDDDDGGDEDDSDDHNGGDDGAEDEELDNGDGDEISLISKSFMIVYFLIDFATMEMTGGGMYVASSAKKGQGFCRIW